MKRSEVVILWAMVAAVCAAGRSYAGQSVGSVHGDIWGEVRAKACSVLSCQGALPQVPPVAGAKETAPRSPEMSGADPTSLIGQTVGLAMRQIPALPTQLYPHKIVKLIGETDGYATLPEAITAAQGYVALDKTAGAVVIKLDHGKGYFDYQLNSNLVMPFELGSGVFGVRSVDAFYPAFSYPVEAAISGLGNLVPLRSR